MAVDKDWVASLEQGDEVARHKKGWGFRYWEILKVEKITPSGRLKLTDGSVFNPNGYLRGNGGYSTECIEPVTEKIRESVWRMKTIDFVERYNIDFDKLSNKELKELHIMISQFPKKDN